MITLISFILVMIGSLNWLTISIFQFDIVAWIFGSQANTFARIVFGLVGIAALILIYAAYKNNGHIHVDGSMHSDEELLAMSNEPDIDEEI